MTKSAFFLLITVISLKTSHSGGQDDWALLRGINRKQNHPRNGKKLTAAARSIEGAVEERFLLQCVADNFFPEFWLTAK